jgi:hypothetical protein
VAARPDFEFRGFVYNNELHALSQYDYVSLYPHLRENRDRIQQRVLDFFHDKIRPNLLDYKNYVMDLFVGEDEG